ncbi:MAG: dockerin type I domain-containing protein [Thermoguttaceae bacterium]
MRSSRSVQRCRSNKVTVARRSLRLEMLETRALLSGVGLKTVSSPIYQFDHILYDPTTRTALPSAQNLLSNASSKTVPLGSSSPVGFTPAQIRTAYGINSIMLGSVVGNGAGQTVAIIDAYNDPAFVDSTDPSFDASDLHTFDVAFGLPDPPSFRKLDEYGGTNYPANDTTGWSTEMALDVEWSHAIAPEANIILIEANTASDADLISAAVNTARNLPGVSAVTMSFGRSEDSSDAGLDSLFTTPSGHSGVTFLASTGDGGAPGGFPAFSPNVVAVGGTTLTIDPSTYAWVGESGWSGSGGGQSTYEAEPTYQDGVQRSGWRQIPDVAFDADPASGVAVYDSYGQGGWLQVGGTSVASPCYAGLIAIGDQLRVSVGLAPMDGPTQTLPRLYAMPATDFHDITTGNNGFAAGPGYDLVTGIGSPVANKLVPDFAPSAPRGVVTFGANSYQIGTPVSVMVRDSNAATCQVTLVSSAGDSETLALAAQGSGIFTGTIATSAAAVAQNDGTLEVLPGGQITVYYDDVNDGTGHAAVSSAQATMYDPLQVTTATTLPAASENFAYSTTLAATGGIGAYTWSAPGLGNYTESNPGTGWLGGGTAQGWHADDLSWKLSLPFAFPFYGSSYSSLWVCSNGFLDFASSAPAFANSDAALEASPRIAPLWEDLTTTTDGDDIFVTSNANDVVVRWAAHTVSGSNPVNFEAVLYPNGDIEFNYGAAMSGIAPTIGVSKGDNLHYTLSSLDGATTIPANVSSLMAHPLPGLSLSPAGVLSGTPTLSGEFSFSVNVADSASPPNTATESVLLDVVTLPPLTVTIPASATKGVSPQTGTVSIPAALASDLVVTLSSNDTGDAAVPATVTIPAGQTSAPFSITIADDANINGIQDATIAATATGYVSGSGTIAIHDSQTATLTVSLPASMPENTEAPVLAGTVTSSVAPSSDITVQLTSSDPTGLTTPPTVVLDAGTTTAQFYLIMHDDHVIEGNRSISVTASVPDWTSGSASMIDLDDDATLEVILPASTWEGQGVQHNAGTVQIGGTLTVPLVVTLASSNTAELTVQPTVTIPAGQTSASFDFTAVQNSLHQGPQSVQVTATATGLASGTTSLQVLDDNLDHFSFDTIAGPETAGVPFAVTIRACDVLNNPILVYSGTASLTASGQSGSLPVTPTSITFASGVWMGNVAVNAVDPTVTLHLSNGAGQTATSGSFAVQYGALASFQWSTIASPQTQGTPFPVTLTAKDANGFTVSDFTGAVTLSGLVKNVSGHANQVLLLSDSIDDYFQTALTALGMKFVTYTDDSDFETALASANPSTTLAIVDNALYEDTFANVPAFINDGGAVVFESWYLEGLPSVASALGASVVSTYSTPLPVYDWGGSSLFAGLTSPINFQQYYYYYNGQFLQPAGNGVAVAGFQSTPAANQAALITGNSGRTILNGFLLDNVVSSKAAVQLAENEIEAAISNLSSPVPITPTTATLHDGAWSGNLSVWPGTSSMSVRASYGSGYIGNSNTFAVAGIPAPLTVTVPTDATEGNPPVTGTVNIPAALGVDLPVSLTSSSSAYATVPSTVIVPAGQTSASFPITIFDNTILEGAQSVLITATAPGFVFGSSAITVHDEEAAVLRVSMLSSAQETAAPLTGTITASQAPAKDITVQLTSSYPAGLSVPATVILHAGTTTASFGISMHDDHVIEGNQHITVTASVENWTSGSASLTDIDEDATLAVILPASGWKGQTLSGAGTLQLGGTLTTNLVVPLTSSDPTELILPATVTIPAGQTSATFDVILPDNNIREGSRIVQATATAPGLAVRNASMTVGDSDVDHFTFDPISGTPAAGIPFAVTVRAYDIQNSAIAGFNGTAKLTAYGQSGPLSISPTPITFSSGVWSGTITLSTGDPDVRLQATAGDGAMGTSSAFVVSQLQVTTPSPLPPAGASQPYSATLAATGGVGSYKWSVNGTNYTESQSASGWLGGGTAQGWNGFDESWSLTLPWAFTYYGKSYTSVWVSSSGFLDFTSSAVPEINSDSALEAAVCVAPIWEEYMTTLYTGDNIFLTTNANYTAIRWAGHTLDTDSPVNVEAVLFANGSIEFNYGASVDAESPTIGISAGDGKRFVLSRYDNATSIPAYASELFTPPSSLPPGLSLSSAGVLSGTPTTLGGYDFYLTVTDSALPADTVASLFHLDVVSNLLSLTVPAEATSGDGAVSGTVGIPSALDSPLTVNLASADTTRVTVPSSVTIPAGQTSAAVPITIVDNTALDGIEPVLITATAAGYTSGSGTITVHDDQTATLTVSLPTSVQENAGVLVAAGTITASQAPARNITVQLTSGNAARLLVPATVVLFAGQTSATFSLTPVDDHVVETTPTPITVTAHVENWTDGVATVNLLDDDQTMNLTLPASITEGQSAQLGTVQIGGTRTSPLVVSLVSGNTGAVTVPSSVTIPAGRTSANFTLTPAKTGLSNGPQSVQVTATAAGSMTAKSDLTVMDDVLNHYAFDAVSGPVSDGVSFGVTVRAFDLLNNPILGYSGTVSLTAFGQAGPVTITPTSITLTSGVWSGSVTVIAVDPGVTLRVANSSGMIALSNVFAVQPGPVASFHWSTIATPQIQGVAFPVTLTALDAHGFTATNFTGSATVVSPAPTLPILTPSFTNGVWTGNVTVWRAVNAIYFQANDGNGHIGDSNAFNVRAETAPVATVALNSHAPATNDVLTATATKSDAQGDPVTLTFVWSVNGVVERIFTSASSLTDSFDLSVLGYGVIGDTITVSVTPDDGYLFGASATDTATLTAAPPALTVGNAGAITFIRGGSAVAVAPNLTVTDVSYPSLLSATVALVGGPLDAGAETLAANTTGTSITASYDAANGVLSLSGSDTLADYQQVLQSVTYIDTLTDTANTGNRTLSFSVSDASNTSTPVNGAVAFDIAPQVVGVYVSGIAWNPACFNALAAAGVGNATLGYELADGAGQLSNANVVGWVNVNQVSIVFSKPVSGVAAWSLALADSGDNGGTPSGITVSSETSPSSTIATFTLSGPLSSNKYYLVLAAAGITDAAGAALDGEWTTGVSTFAAGSGDGAPGGNLNFRFNVLAGDVNRDGEVSAADAAAIRNQPLSTDNATNWRYDVNGDGKVSAADVDVVRFEPAVTIGSFPEPVLPPLSSISGSTVSSWTDTAFGSTVGSPGLGGATGDEAMLDSPVWDTVNLDGVSPSLANLTFDTTGNYTIAQGSGGTLQLANGTSPATLAVAEGSDTISAPVALDSDVAVLPGTGSQLIISGGISGAGQSLTVNGQGVVVLTGTNSYTGGTAVTAGTLILANSSAIAENTSLTVGAGAAFLFASSSDAIPSAVVAATPPATASSAVTTVTSNTASAATTGDTSPAAPDDTFAAAFGAASAATPNATTAAPAATFGATVVPIAAPVGTVVASVAKRTVGDLAWLAQAASSSVSSEPQHQKLLAIRALEAVFAQYGQ